MAGKDEEKEEVTVVVVEVTVAEEIPTTGDGDIWTLELPGMAELGTIVVTHNLDTPKTGHLSQRDLETW